MWRRVEPLGDDFVGSDMTVNRVERYVAKRKRMKPLLFLCYK